MTTSREGIRFHFDDFTLDLGKYRLTRDDDVIGLGKLTFELLRVLVEAAPNAVPHETLIESVWGPKKIVSPETLSQRVTLLRRALGDDAEHPRYIEVIRGQGYRIIPDVRAETPDPGQSGGSASGLDAHRSSSMNGRRVAAILAVAGVAIGLTGWVLYLRNVPVPEDPPQIVRFAIQPPAEFPFATRPFSRDIAISLDGTRLAYSSTGGSIVVRPLESLEVIPLPNLASEVHSVTFSPDGKHLAFLTGGSLRAVSVDGGPVRVLADVGQYTEEDIEWTRAGFLLVANPRGLLRVPSDGGKAELLIAPDSKLGERAFRSPTLLPDGRTVVFVVLPDRSGEQNRIVTFDLLTGTRKVLLTGGAQPRYSPTGHLVIAVDNELRALPIDIDELEIAGEPVTVARGVAVNVNLSANYSIADNGTLVYVPRDTAAAGRSLVWVTRDGDEEVIPVPPMMISYPRLSPDGSRIALDVRWSESDIWLWDIRREVLSRLTNDPAENALPEWHPSGQHLLFSDGRNGTLDIFSADIRDGSVTELVAGERREMPVSYSADGRFLLYGEDQPLGYWSTMVLDVESGKRWPLQNRDHPTMNPMFSPDGEWVVYGSRESGEFEVYVTKFSDPNGQRWQVSHGGGSKPLWSRDGKEIFYISLDGQLMSAEVLDGPDFALGPVTHVLDGVKYFGPQVGTGGRPYDQSLDGERFLMARPAAEGSGSIPNARIVVVLNSLNALGN